jgi:hypothetical protein
VPEVRNADGRVRPPECPPPVRSRALPRGLEYLAEQCDARSDPQITISRLRRSTSVAVMGGKRVAAQRNREPFFTSILGKFTLGVLRSGRFAFGKLRRNRIEPGNFATGHWGK